MKICSFIARNVFSEDGSLICPDPVKQLTRASSFGTALGTFMFAAVLDQTSSKLPLHPFSLSYIQLFITAPTMMFSGYLFLCDNVEKDFAGNREKKTNRLCQIAWISAAIITFTGSVLAQFQSGKGAYVSAGMAAVSLSFSSCFGARKVYQYFYGNTAKALHRMV